MSSSELTEQAAHALKEWFETYTGGFHLGTGEWQQNIVLKIEHTRRVCERILQVGSALDLDAAGLRLAEIIALFHDIGRFEQYARYKTFVDAKSENHAALGVRILEENKVVDHLDSSLRHIILQAVLLHNRASLPETENEQVLFYSRLVRDADKLDIYKVVTDYYQQSGGRRNSAIELDLPDTDGISECVFRGLLQHRIIDIRHISNLNDFKMLQVGWVFDINFGPTFHLLKEGGYLQIIQRALPPSDRIDRIFKEVRDYLDSRQ